jgi:hypothetical protein
MNAELIIAGVIILGVTALLQLMRYSSAFQLLVMTFTYLWSALIAMQGWSLCLDFLTGLHLPDLTAGQLAVLAYWGVFAVALLLASLPKRFWLRSFSTTFSVLPDQLLHLSCILLMAAGTASLLTMSAALALPEKKADPKDMIQWAFVKTRSLPLQAYLLVTDACPGDVATAAARRARLPKPARDLLP